MKCQDIYCLLFLVVHNQHLIIVAWEKGPPVQELNVGYDSDWLCMHPLYFPYVPFSLTKKAGTLGCQQ